jgi:hypothetical protein
VPDDQRFIEYGAISRAPSPWGFNWRRIGLIAVGLIVATAIYYPFSPGGRQAANMRGAEALLPPIRQALQPDARFGSVQIGVHTSHQGSVIIRGEVASAQDLAALRQIIAARSIPYHVNWAVSVAPLAATTSTSPQTQPPAD